MAFLSIYAKHFIDREALFFLEYEKNILKETPA